MENDNQGNNQSISWLAFFDGIGYRNGPVEIMIELSSSEVRVWLEQNEPPTERRRRGDGLIFFVRKFDKAPMQLFSTKAVDVEEKEWISDVRNSDIKRENIIAWDVVKWVEIELKAEED